MSSSSENVSQFFGFRPEDNVLLVEDHPLILQSLKANLKDAFPNVNILEAPDETVALQKSFLHKLRLGMFDIYLDTVKSYETIRQVRLRHPKMKTIIYTGTVTAEVVHHGQDLGVNGFISKTSPPSEIISIINQVMMGQNAMCGKFQKAAEVQQKIIDQKSVLTPREREVLDYTLAGMSLLEIANKANISPATVKKHRQSILQKLNFSNSAKMVAYFNQIEALKKSS